MFGKSVRQNVKLIYHLNECDIQTFSHRKIQSPIYLTLFFFFKFLDFLLLLRKTFNFDGIFVSMVWTIFFIANINLNHIYIVLKSAYSYLIHVNEEDIIISGYSTTFLLDIFSAVLPSQIEMHSLVLWCRYLYCSFLTKFFYVNKSNNIWMAWSQQNCVGSFFELEIYFVTK